MLDLSDITDRDVREKLERELARSIEFSDRWRVVGTALNSLQTDSFSDTRTYPRPDHPNPLKRRPVEFLLVAVLVSLRTTLENEQKAMNRVLEVCQNVSDLNDLTYDELVALIKPAGMPEQKSQRIIKCLERVGELDGGLQSLEHRSKEDARDYLLSLPGIGPKAADCVLSIGLGHPSIVVDVNVFRMASFLFGVDKADLLKYSNAKAVTDIKTRLDVVVGQDVFLCQIIHTMLLLAGRRFNAATHSSEKCAGGYTYCLTCERERRNNPSLF